MIQKWDLSCCSLTQITASNEDSFESLRDTVDILKEEAKRIYNTKIRGGQRACFTICVMPYEQPLKDKLERLGFRKTYEFSRRRGYPNGRLHMLMLDW